MDVPTRVRTYISEELLFAEGGARRLADDTPLLRLIESAALMELVMYLEEEFDVEIDDGEVTPEHFATVGDIARLIASKQDG